MVSPSNQNTLTRLVATKLGARLWRMTVGFGWIAAPRDTVKATKVQRVLMQPGDVLLRQARPFKAGVEGMSDNGGFVPVVVTQEMVGQTLAVSLWVEDKQGAGVATPEQKAFIKFVRSWGGRAGISRSDDDTAAIIRGEVCD